MPETRGVTDRDHLKTAERGLKHLAAEAGLPEPDEVEYRDADGEVVLLWHELKLAVVVECGA